MRYEYLDRNGAQWLFRKIKDGLSEKVDKLPGKGLSTNDLTEELKKAYDGAVEGVAELKNSQTGSAGAANRTPGNLLDNSNFANPVAQAGVGGTHGTDTYAVDRWILESGNVEYVSGIGLKLTGAIKQKLERAPGTVSAFVGMVDGTAEITYSEKVVTVSSVGGILQWAALYPGSLEETPAYVAKGYAAELAECMRYYQRITGMNDSDVYPVLAYGPAANSSTFRAYIPMPVPMRTMPTLDYSSSLQCQWPNGTTGIDKLALMPEACSTRFLSVLCTSAGLSSGVVYALRGNNDKAAYISFCADL